MWDFHMLIQIKLHLFSFKKMKNAMCKSSFSSLFMNTFLNILIKSYIAEYEAYVKVHIILDV